MDVYLVVTGNAAPDSLVTQELVTLQVEADALSIPDELQVSVEDAAIGTRVLAGDVVLPPGVELRTDPDQLVVNVVGAPTAEDLAADSDSGDETASAAGPGDEQA